MATQTDVVIGTYAHGDDEGGAATTLSKRINDITTAATTIHSVSVVLLDFDNGSGASPRAMAIIVWA